MFVREKTSGKIYSANQIEDTVALIPIDGFVYPHVSKTTFVSADKFCEEFLRVNPVDVRDTYRAMKANA